MSVETDPTLELVDNIQHLSIQEDNEKVGGVDQDDGYSSSSSSASDCNTINKQDVVEGDAEDNENDRKESKQETGEKEDDNDEDEKKDDKDAEKDESDDDEKILEPLQLIEDKPEECPKVEILSRGPVSVNSEHRNRYTPYRRPDQMAGGGGGLSANLCLVKDDEPRPQPIPNLLIPTTGGDPYTLTKIDVKVQWTDQHELSIPKHLLPPNTVFVEGTGQVKMYVQMDPNVKDMKSFPADVKTEKNQESGEDKFIGPIVISIKLDLLDSQEKMLLAELKDEDCMAARNLVDNKDISELVKVMGPRDDTVLSILCGKSKATPGNAGEIAAQIYYLVQRLLRSQNPQHVNNVFQLNKRKVSAFEVAAITNNSLVACYLAEVMYNYTEDTKTALGMLNSTDNQGNTIIHLLARKGDPNAETLRRCLAMRLTDNTRVFRLSCNAKGQSPLHISVQRTNQPETIALLSQAIKNGFEAQDDDGMIPLHYAAQRSTDPQLLLTVLSYKKDNINTARKDGLTPLDLLSLRPNYPTNDNGAQTSYVIDKKTQCEMIKLLKDNGAKSCVEEQQRSPLLSQNGYDMEGSPSPPKSPVGSPYSSTASPRTLPDDCPSNIYTNMQVAGSVESYAQSSPESEHCDFNTSTTRNYSFMPNMMSNRENNYQDGFYGSQNQEGGPFNLEDHIASQLLHEFPEIRGYVGQIIDGNM